MDVTYKFKTSGEVKFISHSKSRREVLTKLFNIEREKGRKLFL
jgi:hypothetical protein